MKLPENMDHTVLVGLVAVVLCAAAVGCAGQPSGAPGEGGVRVVPNEEAQRVDVFIDGKPFTSYLYTDTLSVLKKPVLYPLRAPDGTMASRGYPLDPRPGESEDHPHHIGFWLNYGNVNGVDFWGHSDETPAERLPFMGTIRHRTIERVESGGDRGLLEVAADWQDAEGETLLEEETRFVFRDLPGAWAVDRISTLTAQDEAVRFADTKEGMLGLRVTRGLEHPSDEPTQFTDAHGDVTEVAPDAAGATGRYRSSEGITGTDVWGTRARWMTLSGVVEGDSVTVAIFDHPQNPGHPTYWHARGYGLFAANPFGWKDFTEGREELNFSLAPGESTTFRHRVVLFADPPTTEQVETLYRAFAEVD